MREVEVRAERLGTWLNTPKPKIGPATGKHLQRSVSRAKAGDFHTPMTAGAGEPPARGQRGALDRGDEEAGLPLSVPVFLWVTVLLIATTVAAWGNEEGRRGCSEGPAEIWVKRLPGPSQACRARAAGGGP